MSITNWREVVVRPDASLRFALERLDSTAAQILLIADGTEKLMGTITDGDIRRAILGSVDLSVPVTDVMNLSPITGRSGLRPQDAIAVMRRLSIHALPIVNSLGIIEELLFDVEIVAAAPRQTAVLLMVGGRGKRLRPLTDTLPKPLLRVGGVPLAEATIRRLQAQGFTCIWLAVHYRADDIEAHFGDGSKFGVTISYLREQEPLGTVGAVGLLPDDARDAVLVVNGDLVSSIDFGSLVDQHKSTGAVATIGAVAHITELPFGVVRESDGILSGIDEKPVREDLVASGVTVLARRAIEHVSPEVPCDMPDLMRTLLNEGEEVRVTRLEAYWLDVGTQAALASGQSDHSTVTTLPKSTTND